LPKCKAKLRTKQFAAWLAIARFRYTTERPIRYIKSDAGFKGLKGQSQNWNYQIRTGFIKQNLNFKNSQELKGRSEKFKNP
jgi:hypothetical protein